LTQLDDALILDLQQIINQSTDTAPLGRDVILALQQILNQRTDAARQRSATAYVISCKS
jgi:hypothetical protein